MDFAKRFKELRIEKELNQTEFAKIFKMDRSSVGKWEKGTSTPNTDLLAEIAEFFNVTTDYLLGLSDIRDPYEVETIAAHKDGEEWTEEEMAAIEQFKAFVRSQKMKRE